MQFTCAKNDRITSVHLNVTSKTSVGTTVVGPVYRLNVRSHRIRRVGCVVAAPHQSNTLNELRVPTPHGLLRRFCRNMPHDHANVGSDRMRRAAGSVYTGCAALCCVAVPRRIRKVTQRNAARHSASGVNEPLRLACMHDRQRLDDCDL